MRWLQWLEENLSLTIATYIAAIAVVVTVIQDNDFAHPGLSAYKIALTVLVSLPATVLFVFSLGGLVAYFVFIPSISGDGHIFVRVHATHLVHPLTTAVVLGLLALCLVAGSPAAWIMWGLLAGIYAVQTALIVRKMRGEHLMNSANGPEHGVLFTFLSLVLGGEIITVAAGAKPLSPWRLSTLPEDTWIVDVRTKAEFNWNRLQAAENFPWGAGVMEAAQQKSKDTPVLVTCLSGHRSPAVAVMLRKLGFKTVYNLNWGILYLILLQRGAKVTGPFSLKRSHSDPNMRGPDFREIAIGYITFAFLVLIVAPSEHVLRHLHVPLVQRTVGSVLGLGGLLLGLASYRALGRNFRVFAAPRRSGSLITTGVYAKVRHPMYTAVVVALLGYAVYFGSWYALPFWLCCTVLYMVKAAREEPLLLQRYPDYVEYRKRTWKFVPFVW
jgi:protein-S-isoprenylcysteine O-methyltransferase Ste14/rhodanese-related sulfurtransferase